MWCDAMLVLIHAEWPRARQELLAPATSSTHAVVQAWMQATQVQVRHDYQITTQISSGTWLPGAVGTCAPCTCLVHSGAVAECRFLRRR